MRWNSRPILAIVASLWCLAPMRAVANDHMFKPAPAAAPYINFDGRGFLINGKRTFIVSGSMHYARVPRALWRDRLLKMKRAGFNTVQSYLFWNAHEPEEGKFDFTGRYDLNAFLKLVHSLGMYATVRVGPYYCAEWDSGGYPVWLRFVKGLVVRTPNRPFEDAVHQFFSKLLPIIARNQINHGGSVIMVQLENEHPFGWGTDMPNQYFHFLQQQALEYGIQVPYFFSGEHHGSDPAGNTPWSSAKRVNPWYTTEFWPGWYNLYGPLSPSRLRFFDRGTWHIIAYGGNGYNYYMLHGGSNFGYWNNDEDAASYDYGGAIGQAGDLRPIYYRFKKAAMFATSLPRILEESDDSTSAYANSGSNMQVRITARTAPDGTALFLDNNTNRVQTTALHLLDETDNFKVLSGEVRPIVVEYALKPGITLSLCGPRLLTILDQSTNETTIVVYGPTGSRDKMEFACHAPHDLVGGSHWQRSANGITLTATAETSPQLFSFASAGRVVRVIWENERTANFTWNVQAGGKEFVVTGPAYVGDATLKASRLTLQCDEPAAATTVLPSHVFTASGNGYPLSSPHPEATPMPDAPKLVSWQVRPGDEPSSTKFESLKWMYSPNPRQMGADGYNGCYAWYRTLINANSAGSYTLHFSDVADWLQVFVNGRPQFTGQLIRRTQNPVAQNAGVTLRKGVNLISVFTTHYGRPKRFSYIGPLNTVDRKGLSGPVYLRKGLPLGHTGIPLTAWEWQGVNNPAASDAADAAGPVARGQWLSASIGQDLFNNRPGWVWVRIDLPASKAPHHSVYFGSVDDDCIVYLNGKVVGQHAGWDTAFTVSLDRAWNPDGTNVLAVLIHNTDGTGGLDKPAMLETTSPETGTLVSGWKYHGGIRFDKEQSSHWLPYADGPATGIPTWYRASFTVPAYTAEGVHPIYRLMTTGLFVGSAWLNGHNLGRYPDPTPAPGMYLPESWLKPGKNNIEIFDQQGATAAQVHLIVEQASSWNFALRTARVGK